MMRNVIFSALFLFSLESANAADSPWLEAVTTYADNVLANGRDVYGEKHTPLFVDGLNVDTGKPVEWIYGGAYPDHPVKKWNKYEILAVQHRGDRWMLSDMANQQTLFRTLDGLSTITGDAKYRDAAMEATRYAFKNLQSKSGALFWGAHIAYDALGDKIVLEQHMHEMKFHFPHFPLMMEVSKKDTLDVIEAMWEIHILDWKTLDMNRHGEHLMQSPPRFPWTHRYAPETPPFRATGLSFCGTGCDLMLAGIEYYRYTNRGAPLEWSQRLGSRFSDGRHPDTGLVGYQYTIPDNDRAAKQFGGDANEATLLGPDMIRFRYPRMAVSWIYYSDLTGLPYFRDEAIADLKALAKHAYRPADNTVIGVFTDGTKIDLTKLKKGDYYSEKRLRPREAEPIYFRAYAMAYRASGGKDSDLWKMTGTLARHYDLGDFDTMALNLETQADDPEILHGVLELYRATGKPEFLTLAKKIGDNLIRKRFNKGYFSRSKDFVNVRFDAHEPLALLHLHNAVTGNKIPIPLAWPSTPYFRCNFEGKGRSNDTQSIYEVRRGK